MQQQDIFSYLYEPFKFKKVKLCEVFAGIGATSKAMKRLCVDTGVEFEHHKICEWALPSIIAYASIHRDELPNYGKNYCGDLTKEQIANELFKMGVSLDYDKPAELKQLKNLKEWKLRLAYNSIHWSNNLVDIVRTTADDLCINNDDGYQYMLTYSFPCQSLSLAGNQDNMKDKEDINEDNVYDIENRSSMLWQVDRILRELHQQGKHFDVLMLENVQQLLNSKNKPIFDKWVRHLESYGYMSNYHDKLNSKDYGIPQNRVRVYMFSFYGDYYYQFPKPVKLELRLKDLLEKKVDERFYLSKKMIRYVSASGGGTTTIPNPESTKKSQDLSPQSKINEQAQPIILGMAYPNEFDLNSGGGEAYD